MSVNGQCRVRQAEDADRIIEEDLAWPENLSHCDRRERHVPCEAMVNLTGPRPQRTPVQGSNSTLLWRAESQHLRSVVKDQGWERRDTRRASAGTMRGVSHARPEARFCRSRGSVSEPPAVSSNAGRSGLVCHGKTARRRNCRHASRALHPRPWPATGPGRDRICEAGVDDGPQTSQRRDND